MEKIKHLHHHIKRHSQLLITKWGTVPVIVLLLILPVAIVAAVNEQNVEQNAATGWSIDTGSTVTTNSKCVQKSCTIGTSNCFGTQSSCQTWINDHQPGNSNAQPGTIQCGTTSTSRCFKDQCGSGYTSNGNSPGSGGLCGKAYGSSGICCDVVSGNSKIYGSCAGVNDTNKAICTSDNCGNGVAKNYPNKINSGACSQNCCAIKSISNSSSGSSASSSSSSDNSSSSSGSSGSSSSNGSNSSSSSQAPFPSYVCAGSGTGSGCPPTITPSNNNNGSNGSSGSSGSQTSSGNNGSQSSSGDNTSQSASSGNSSPIGDNTSNGDIFSLIQKLLQIIEQLLQALGGSGSSHHHHHNHDND